MNHYPSIPTATYRFQFRKHFKFDAARALIPYLDELGISHVYASPIFTASPGSPHGYDVCDHNTINPEIGTRSEYDELTAQLKSHGMSQILDFVPNHMGIAEATNGWWMDVLENGPSSPYARYFDIDWAPAKRELESKVLLPILGDQYGRVLERGDLKLVFEDGAFFVEYFTRRLPVAPRTSRPLLKRALKKVIANGVEPPAEFESIIFGLEHVPARHETTPEKITERAREKEIIKHRLKRLCGMNHAVERAITDVVAEIQAGGTTKSFDELDDLISNQPYRLAYWRVAAEEINYRRFFDINNLAALRMELPEVFEAVHGLVFELIGAGAATGLRIDHIDGLWDPHAYLAELQRRARELVGAEGEEKPLYLLVEKILEHDEHLHADWAVHGTTGYEFATQVTAVLIDREAEADFTATYAKFVGAKQSYSEIVYRSKLVTMRVSMASEVNVLGHMLNIISETNRWYRDFTVNALTTAIREVIACFPAYRTYISPAGEMSEADKRMILRAIGVARRRNPALERTVFEFLRDVLIPSADNPHPVYEKARREFVMKFQQCTGPITAKGVEDTSFYVYNRLIALNEVGGDPGKFGADAGTFHAQNAARLAEFPHSMLATSTHDTKRSEDVRARLAALSELPAEWGRALRRWSAANRKHKTEIDGEMAPDANEEYLLYQTLLGSWPLEPMSAEELQDYIQRIQAYMQKALHEAKVNSSWIEPNAAWDSASDEFVAKILTPGRSNKFPELFAPLAARIAEAGAINSLSQLVLKLTAPGVPDIYQGQEMWDFSLVDPDNRRPVDFEHRKAQLASLAKNHDPADLLANWRDGRLKLFTTQMLLRFRRGNSALFGHGGYTPVTTEGVFDECCIAFHRSDEDSEILVAVPRLSLRVASPPIGDAWGNTRLGFNVCGDWRDVVTGREYSAGQDLRLADVFRDLPFAVLARSAH